MLSRQMFLVQGGPELADRRMMGLLQALQIDGIPGDAAFLGAGSHPFLREFAQDMASRGTPAAPGGSAWAAEFHQQARSLWIARGAALPPSAVSGAGGESVVVELRCCCLTCCAGSPRPASRERLGAGVRGRAQTLVRSTLSVPPLLPFLLSSSPPAPPTERAAPNKCAWASAEAAAWRRTGAPNAGAAWGAEFMQARPLALPAPRESGTQMTPQSDAGRADWAAEFSGQRQEAAGVSGRLAGGVQTRALVETMAANKDSKFQNSKFLQFVSKMSRGDVVFEGDAAHSRQARHARPAAPLAASWGSPAAPRSLGCCFPLPRHLHCTPALLHACSPRQQLRRAFGLLAHRSGSIALCAGWRKQRRAVGEPVRCTAARRRSERMGGAVCRGRAGRCLGGSISGAAGSQREHVGRRVRRSTRRVGR